MTKSELAPRRRTKRLPSHVSILCRIHTLVTVAHQFRVSIRHAPTRPFFPVILQDSCGCGVQAEVSRRRRSRRCPIGRSHSRESSLDALQLIGQLCAVHFRVAREFPLVAEARDTSLAGLAVVQEGCERRDGARHVFAKVMRGELGPSRRGTISTVWESDGLSMGYFRSLKS